MKGGAKQRLFSTPPSRRHEAAGAGYSWFVRIARVALPVSALVIVGIVAARLSESPQQALLGDLPKTEKELAAKAEKKEQGTLVSARYEGVDDEGRSYTLLAGSATQSPDDPKAVLLEAPKADITLEDGAWVAVHAGSGIWSGERQTLTLSGGVSVFHDQGYEMQLEAVLLDMKTRRAVSRHPVTAKGPAGTLSAQSMQINDQGRKIIFGGPIRMTIARLGRSG